MVRQIHWCYHVSVLDNCWFWSDALIYYIRIYHSQNNIFDAICNRFEHRFLTPPDKRRQIIRLHHSAWRGNPFRQCICPDAIVAQLCGALHGKSIPALHCRFRCILFLYLSPDDHHSNYLMVVSKWDKLVRLQPEQFVRLGSDARNS